MSLADTKKIYDALKESDKKDAKIILLMLYTKKSKGIIIKAKWENVFLEEGLLLHVLANGKRLRILLPNGAVSLIRKLERDSLWLFSSKNKKKPYSDIFLYWNELRKSLGFPNLFLKELQDSYAHWRYRLGNSDLIDESLNSEDIKELSVIG